jgi:hypothetical protein
MMHPCQGPATLVREAAYYLLEQKLAGRGRFSRLFLHTRESAHGRIELAGPAEGDFYDAGKDVPDVASLSVGVYSSNREAERMVGIIGIRNAQLGYFRGETKLMGA